MTTRITIEGRLAFAVIREPEQFQGTGKPRFSGTVLFDKADTKTLAKVEKAMAKAAELKWGAKGASTLTALRAGLKTALTDGDIKAEYDGFADHWAVASHTPDNTPPTLVDRSARPLDRMTQNMIYSGAKVRMIVDFWAQDNQWGKRLNAQLAGVQFVADDTPFAGGVAAGAGDFEELEAPSDADGFSAVEDDDLA